MLCLFLTACSNPDAPSGKVDATQYESFWLWAGVKPQPVLDQAKTIYMLGAEVRASDPREFEILRPSPPMVDSADIWFVIRLETLDLDDSQYKGLIDLVRKWDGAGNSLTGLQVDFDANTRGLDGYADFLKKLRSRLPSQYKLGVTGLLDWSANGDPTQLQNVADSIDEAVFQTYQGRHTIAGYEKWLRNLDDLPMPFHIGLVQNGDWREPEGLRQNPNFRGYVVFLLNPMN